MASKTAGENDEGVTFIFPADDAKKSLFETGAYVRDDASAGHRIDDFVSIKEFPLRKVEGLDFCAQNSLYDETMRDVIESSINRPYWGLAKLYNSAVLPSNTANFFMAGPTIRVVCILLFTPNTQLILFEGSHNKKVPGKVMSKFGLLTLPQDMLEIEGIRRVEYHLKQGGFAFIDGRTGWTILKGEQFVIGCASEEEIARWGELELGDTAPLRSKVAELRTNEIKAKFKFILPRNTSSSA